MQYWKIYNQAFPDEERRGEEAQKKLLKNEKYDISLYYKNDKVIGFMALWKLKKFTFLEHFAVNEKFRGKGLGRKILKDIKMKYGDSLILEVELPYNSIAVRRINFYKRAGFHYNNYPYFQPPYQEGRKPVELRIMSYPTAVSKEKFEVIKQMLYNQVYNIK